MQTVVVNGAFTGLVYGLLAVGLVVIYRCSRVVNFAYGEIGMVGAFLFTELWVDGATPLFVALIAGVGASAAVGGLTERFVIRRLRDQPRLTSMVATLAIAAVLLTFASRRYGVSPRYTEALVGGDVIRFGSAAIQPSQLLILLVAVVVMAGLWAVYRFTAFGLRLRATAIDPDAAGLVGVNSHATALTTWAAAGALAGVSAIIIAPSVSFSVFFMTGLLLRSLAAALVGGLTSVGGAFGAGVMLGIGEAVVGYAMPVTGGVEVVIALAVIGLLLARPQGLFRSAY